MSGPLAVATVTSALQHLLTAAVKHVEGGADISTRPPDKARDTPFGANNQLNVFLYHTTLDVAWRNQDLPGVKPGESGFPPLPLVLHYLITAYGEGDDEVKAHTVFGHAVSVLHDHPILGPDEFAGLVDGSDLDRQVERVHITPQTLTVDEMTKLWTAFATNARLSACYEVSVVLISSAQQARTPLPVLTRGKDDSGVLAQADTDLPFPALDAAVPPNRQPAVLAGDELTLTGHHLLGATEVTFTHPRIAVAAADPTSVTDTKITVPVAATVPAGVYVVAAAFGAPDRATNGLPLAVAPEIASGLPVTLTPDATGAVTVDLTCAPDIQPGQDVFLLLGERQIPLPPPLPAAPTATLSFAVPDATPGDYLVRLRVDGVDSLLVDRRPTPPVFNQDQRVTIT